MRAFPVTSWLHTHVSLARGWSFADRAGLVARGRHRRSLPHWA